MFGRPPVPSPTDDLLRECVASLVQCNAVMADALRAQAAAQERAADAQLATVAEQRAVREQRDAMLKAVESPEAELPQVVAETVRKFGGTNLMQRADLARYARKRLGVGVSPDQVAGEIARGDDPRKL